MNKHENPRHHAAAGVAEAILIGVGAMRAVEAFKKGNLAEGSIASLVAIASFAHRAHVAWTINDDHWNNGKIRKEFATPWKPRPKIAQV